MMVRNRGFPATKSYGVNISAKTTAMACVGPGMPSKNGNDIVHTSGGSCSADGGVGGGGDGEAIAEDDDGGNSREAGADSKVLNYFKVLVKLYWCH